MKNTKAYIIMLNGKPKMTIIGPRSTVAPILSKMRTAHLLTEMGNSSRHARDVYNNLNTWHVESTEYQIKELKIERGKNRVDRH